MGCAPIVGDSSRERLIPFRRLRIYSAPISSETTQSDDALCLLPWVGVVVRLPLILHKELCETVSQKAAMAHAIRTK
jgi:hypothetical protein